MSSHRFTRFSELPIGTDFCWRGLCWRKVPKGSTEKPFNAVYLNPISGRIQDRGLVSDETLVYLIAKLPPPQSNVIDLASWRQRRAKEGA